ncbi:hypothetical protein ACFQ4C_26480 [Larkinella insperata]|uniref:Uncharacterized protein n=1 Tax=Larkinella insperata TaxID=332158 RepID=A0ABW3QLR5_9BACT|nr:hypothetical protein [Larkinella insperata]
MTSKIRYNHPFGAHSGHLARSPNRVRPSKPAPREPWQPDWLMILMVSLFVLTLMIAWLVDIPALLR